MCSQGHLPMAGWPGWHRGVARPEEPTLAAATRHFLGADPASTVTYSHRFRFHSSSSCASSSLGGPSGPREAERPFCWPLSDPRECLGHCAPPRGP